MNRKKQLTFVLLGMIIILPMITTGCFKKGEDDPFISIYTRKARMTGTWKYAEMSSQIRRSEAASDDILIIVTNANSASWNQRITIYGTDSIRDLKGKVYYDQNYITFKKNGSFEQNFIYEYSVDSVIGDDEGVKTTTTIITESSVGTWNFLGKIEDDYKNKERVTLNYTRKTNGERITVKEVMDDDEGPTPIPTIIKDERISELFANGEFSEIWTLIGLKNKEIIMEQDVNTNIIVGNGSSDSGQSTISETGKRRQVLRK